MPATTRPIVILGPTAGGKSELAVALAEQLPGGGEVLSADSMQVYRHMDAGTAKPSADLRARAPHHLIDIVEPTQRFTVHDWLKRAQNIIAELRAAGKHPIVVGGTNLYIKSLLEGLFDGPPADPAFRESLKTVSDTVLHERLIAIDPAAAKRIHPNDHKRLVRALEVHHATGQPISAWQTQWNPQSPTLNPETRSFILIGLDWPVDEINQRINARVKAMFFPTDDRESLQDEARRLDHAGLLGEQAREALGYKQVLECPAIEDAFERTKILTRRFAKQQRTWLRRFRAAHWIDATQSHDQVFAEALTTATQNLS